MNSTTSIPSLQSTADRFSLVRGVFLHLAPGVAIMAVFAALARLTAPAGWPASLALLVTWLMAGLPLLIGILIYQGHQVNGRPTLKGLLLYREPLPVRYNAWLVPALLVWSAVWSTVLFSFGESIHRALFNWWPDSSA